MHEAQAVKSPSPSLGPQVQELLAQVNALAGQLRMPEGAGHPTFGVRAVLKVLGEEGSWTVPGIARARGSSRQSVQVVVNRLAKRGWVELRHNPAHQRSALICLTPRGRRLLLKVNETENARLEEQLRAVSAQGIGRACAVLRQVRAALGAGQPAASRTPLRVRRSGTPPEPRAPQAQVGTRPAQPESAETAANGSAGEVLPPAATPPEPALAPADISAEPDSFPISLL